MSNNSTNHNNGVKVQVSGRILLDVGGWDKYCEDYGINPWAINEGLLDSGESLTITVQQAYKYGVLKDNGPVGREYW